LSTARLAASGVFDGFRVIIVPTGEEGAANAIRVNEHMLLNDACPHTAELLAAAGYAVKGLPLQEMAKLDAGLSCMSLRWRA
jgi:dimethylargininase